MHERLTKILYRLMPAYRLYNGLSMSFLSRFPIGTNVYERDWDLLILLDTCRVDALKEVAPEYDFIHDVGSILSVGSSSSEWIAQTFTRDRIEEVQETAYVSANAWAKRVIEDRNTPEGHANALLSWTDWDVCNPHDFLALEQAWETAPQLEYDIDAGGTTPRYLTDRAIAAAREYEPDRLIVHYIQPHRPYTSEAISEGRPLKPHEKNPWEYLRNGGELDRVWTSYLNQLRYALDSIKILINNINADRAILSADHGDAFGEYGFYAHGVGVPHPHVRRVPWAVTTSEDRGEYEVKNSWSVEKSRSAEDDLKALGYLN